MSKGHRAQSTELRAQGEEKGMEGTGEIAWIMWHVEERINEIPAT